MAETRRVIQFLAMVMVLAVRGASVFADNASTNHAFVRFFKVDPDILARPAVAALIERKLDEFLAEAPRAGAAADFMVDGVGYLHMASLLGYPEFIGPLVERGADVNGVVARGRITPLIVAASVNKDACIRELLVRGANLSLAMEDGTTAMHLAAKNGSRRMLDQLVRAGADVQGAMNDGRTPLMIAAAVGSFEALTFLIESGASLDVVDAKGRTALHYASGKNHTDLVLELLRRGADAEIMDRRGMTPLMSAAWGGSLPGVGALLNGGARADMVNESGYNALAYALDDRLIYILDLLYDAGASVFTIDEDGDTLLHLAAKRDSPDVIAWLLERGVDINYQNNNGVTALWRAVSERSEGAAEALIKAGADVNAANSSGYTPLMIGAARGGMTGVLKALADAGADIQAARAENGQTALYSAAVFGGVAEVDFLLDRGADMHWMLNSGSGLIEEAQSRTNFATMVRLLEAGLDPDIAGNTRWPAIMDVCWNGRTNYLAALLEHGANPNFRDAEGHTPLMVAVRRGHSNVVEQLLACDADPALRDDFGFTAWHYAQMARQPALAERLAGRMSDEQRQPTHRVTVYFDLDAPQASRVQVVGTFNEWNTERNPMFKREDDGWWYAEVDLFPGAYSYKIVTDGAWNLDPGNPQVVTGINFTVANSFFHTDERRVGTRPDRPPSAREFLQEVVFTYHDPDARVIHVAGEFNGWNTVASRMKKGGGGVWKAWMRLLPGEYGYKYVVDGEWVLDPSNTEYKVIGGATNSLLRVVAPVSGGGD